MNKVIIDNLPLKMFVLFTSLFVFNASAEVITESDICANRDVVIAFFNGVNTTPSGANRAKEELKRIHGEESSVGDVIQYEVLYNYTAGFEDFVETFDQRLMEQDQVLEGRYELFFEALRNDGPWWSALVNTVPSTADILNGTIDKFKADTVQSLTLLQDTLPATENYAEHQARIDNWVVKGFKLLYVAHSQGNLFANAAYQYTTTKRDADSVKVVHVAPVSPSLNGGYTLADLDSVMNELKLVGNILQVTDNIPDYLSRPAGVNGNKDILGHGFIEIYINQELTISNRVKKQINDALSTLVFPSTGVSQGFFTAQLTWDGPGDADLHVIEPDGDHIYFAYRLGMSGHLEVDNTYADGPEHYYTSCNPNYLQTGLYKILVANNSRAEGRLATVQIDSTANGVIGTQSVILGNPTGDLPVFHVFNVMVTKNEDTNKYSVDIINDLPPLSNLTN